MYRSKYSTLPGTSYKEVVKNARNQYRIIQQRTKRQPYVRSKYFGKDKVFINLFFVHLMQKRAEEKQRRAKLFLCAVDLLRNSMIPPQTILKNDNLNELLHRFEGVSKDGQRFYVQVKQNKRTNRKDFMSVFPAKDEN